MTDEKVETERVVQMWPVDLKKKVRDHAGARGITAFTLEAVRAHLGVAPVATSKDDEKELNETRYLAQLLADCVAMGGSQEDRFENLREIELPPWITTLGWPQEMVELVRPPVVEPEPEPEPELEPERVVPVQQEREPSSPATLAGQPNPFADPNATDPAPDPFPAAPVLKGDDFFARVQGQAQSMGLDLKPATAIATPEKEGRGTPTEPVFVDPPTEGSKLLGYLDHAHSTVDTSVCLKNRFGDCQVEAVVVVEEPTPEPVAPEVRTPVQAPAPVAAPAFEVPDIDVGF